MPITVGTRQVLVDVFAADGPLLFTYPMTGNLDDAGFKKLGVQNVRDDKLNGAQPFWAMVWDVPAPDVEDRSAAATNTYSMEGLRHLTPGGTGLRRLVTKEELQEWMTTQLRRHEGCENVSFGAVNRLQQPDDDGCNWSRSVFIHAGNTPREVWGAGADRVMQEARAKFNLLDRRLRSA